MRLRWNECKDLKDDKIDDIWNKNERGEVGRCGVHTKNDEFKCISTRISSREYTYIKIKGRCRNSVWLHELRLRIQHFCTSVCVNGYVVCV